jgi:hypothetical protein
MNTNIISGLARPYELIGRHFLSSIREYSCSFVAEILFLEYLNEMT